MEVYFLSAAHKLCDRFSCLYYLQSHTVSELKLKFGDRLLTLLAE